MGVYGQSGARPGAKLWTAPMGERSDWQHLVNVLNCDDTSGAASDAAWRALASIRQRALDAEAALARVRELCDLTERTVLDAMPELEGKVVVYTSLVRRALDGGDA